MSPTTAWAILFIAGLFETGWAIGLKYSHGSLLSWSTALTAISMAISIYLLSVALKVLPVGTGYAVWTGIGALGTAILGMIIFQESRDTARLVCLGLIISGIIGLKMVTK